MSLDKPPQGVLGYADNKTDVEQAENSFDREMTKRLSRVIGICLVIFAGLLMLLSCAGLTVSRANSSSGPLAFLAFLFLGYVLPGFILIASVGRTRSLATLVFILLASVWTFCVMATTLAGAIFLFARHIEADATILHSLADLLLMLGIAKLLYHDIRLLAFGGRRGGNAEAIIGLGALFSLRWVVDPELRRWALFAVQSARVLMGLLLALAGGLLLRSALKSPIPSIAPAPAPFVPADLYGAGGLPATERGQATAVFDAQRWMTNDERLLFDEALRHTGISYLEPIRRPITTAAVRNAIRGNIPSQSASAPRRAQFFSHLGATITLTDGELICQTRTPCRIVGNVYIPDSTTRFHNGRWNLQYIESALAKLNQGGGKFTAAQGDAIKNLYTQDEPALVDPEDPIGAPEFRSDGTLKLQYTPEKRPSLQSGYSSPFPVRGKDVWIAPDGRALDQPPPDLAELASIDLQRATRAATLKRLLDVCYSSLATIIGILGISTALVAFRRASDHPEHWPISLPLSVIISAATFFSLLWVCAHALHQGTIGTMGGIIIIATVVGMAIIFDVTLPFAIVGATARQPSVPPSLR
jgi:hypothetical protein